MAESTLAAPRATTPQIIQIDPHHLKAHPRNALIYAGDAPLDTLREAIATSHWVKPLVVNQEDVIVGGHRRWRCALDLRWPAVPCERRHFSSVEEELEAMLLDNMNRDRTPEQRVREARAWEEVEEPGAKGRRLAAQNNDAARAVRATLHELGDTGRTDTRVAARVGMKQRTYTKAKGVVDAADELAEENAKASGAMLRILNEPNVNAAYKLATDPDGVRMAELIADEEANTVNQAKRLVQAERINAEPEPLPSGPFRIIVADPPWKYENRADDDSHRAANPYAEMTIDEIRAMPVGAIAHEDCVLWLWTTNAHMREAFKVLDAWGFEQKTILTWIKDRMGTGEWLRGQTEHCLLATRGAPVVLLRGQTTALNGPMREHSRKPDEFYALVEELCPGSRVELFARQPRDGWQQWGAEAGDAS